MNLWLNVILWQQHGTYLISLIYKNAFSSMLGSSEWAWMYLWVNWCFIISKRSSADCSNIQSFGQLLVTPAMFQKHLVCTGLFVIIISLPQEEHANIYLSVDHIKLWPLNHCCLWFSVCGPEDISCQQSTRFKCVTSVITPVLITTTSVTVTPRLL